ncbi:MAG: hypothetical protein AAB769_02460 [Patescibacteria group bacterium]
MSKFSEAVESCESWRSEKSKILLARETMFRVIQQEQAGLDASERDTEIVYLIEELDVLFARRHGDAKENPERDSRIHFLSIQLKEMYWMDVADEDTCVFV